MKRTKEQKNIQRHNTKVKIEFNMCISGEPATTSTSYVKCLLSMRCFEGTLEKHRLGKKRSLQIGASPNLVDHFPIRITFGYVPRASATV